MNRTDVEAELRSVVDRFRLGGAVQSLAPCGSGHINHTWVSRVATPSGETRYVHQRVNRAVFASPEAVMENVERVTAHLRERLVAQGADPKRRCLTLVPTVDGRSFLRTHDGETWRTYYFIEGAHTHDRAQSPAHVEGVARAFSRFQRMLADLPGPRLHVTIPDFGDAVKRYGDFRAAVDADAAGRVGAAAAEIAFAGAREELTPLLMNLLAAGEVPERVIHYDTKINNVMIDDATGEGICVIDLDTVMPGTALYDFGDAVRLGATRADEDERDLAQVGVDLERFESLVRGWLDEARGFLVPAEVDRLVAAARHVTFLIGLRFLTDHLAGDVYFRVHRPGHNLDRCRVQFALVADIEARQAEMERIVERHR